MQNKLAEMENMDIQNDSPLSLVFVSHVISSCCTRRDNLPGISIKGHGRQ